MEKTEREKLKDVKCKDYKLSNLIDIESLLELLLLGDTESLDKIKIEYIKMKESCAAKVAEIDLATEEELGTLIGEFRRPSIKKLTIEGLKDE